MASSAALSSRFGSNMPEQWNNDSVRALERASIRSFMERSRPYLQGRVLDFGSGKQPYRDLVLGEYVPIDQGDVWPVATEAFACIVCNQVLQYIENPAKLLDNFHAWLCARHGCLVMTYPTNWDEVEGTDLWRFTKAGMELLLKRSRFEILIHERRAEIDLHGFKFPLGYGVVARAY